MKKIGFLAILLIGSLLLTGCNKTVENSEVIDDCVIPEDCTNEEPNEEFISYYENGAIREKGTYIDGMKQGVWVIYDEEGNIIDMQEYKDGQLVKDESESYILSVDEDEILSTDELKKACEKVLWGEKSKDIVTTWTDEKLFINTYSFKGITETDGINTVYCNVRLDGEVLDAAFYLDEGQTIDQLHEEMDFNNPGGFGNVYPNLKEYYGFIGTIVLGNRLQTTYITGKNIMYFDNSRGIALKLGDIPDGGLIREIDTDEGGIPRSEIIFLIKGEENEKNRTGINGYREMFTIVAISKENLENFGASLHDLPFKYDIIGENNQYYFVVTNVEGTYSDLIIFDVEDKF